MTEHSFRVRKGLTVANTTASANLDPNSLIIGSTVANTTGVYTGISNATTHSVGTAYTANSTVVNAAAVNCRGQVNTVTFYATTSANVGANIQVTASQIRVGNSMVNTTISNNSIYTGNSVSNVTLNSTGFWGTANNASYLGGIAAASYLTTTDLDAYQTEAGLASNVATLASNSTTYIPVTNSIVSNSSGVWITAGFGLLTNTTGIHIGTGNGMAIDADAIRVVATNGMVSNTSGIWLTPGSGLVTNTTGLHVGTGNGTAIDTDAIRVVGGSTITVNVTGVHVNSTLTLPTSLTIGTSVVNSTVIATGANVYQNVTTVRIGNSTVETTIGNNIIYVGNSTSNATLNSTMLVVQSSNVLLTGVENQTITGGATVIEKDLGTITTGTLTLDMGDRPHQKYVNGGSHTLAPGTTIGNCLLVITNTTGAVAPITSGWTKKSGDAWTTTSGHKFVCHASVTAAGSLLIVSAMQ